jgi:hypothetical protein
MGGVFMAKLIIRNEDLPAETIDLKPGVHRFGRSSGNEVQIDHSTISRYHCEVEVLEDAMYVRDTDSSNGTFINDQPVEGSARLQRGDTLRLGDVKMEVKEAPEGVNTREVFCTNHPELSASMECTQCHKYFCGSCVHLLKRVTGQYLRLCPVCSGHCEPILLVRQNDKRTLGTLVKKLFNKNRDEKKPYYDAGGETRRL